jgi:steroid 5-alpha reductase family enzyme
MTNPLLTSLVTIFVIQLLFASFAIAYKSDKLTDLSYGLTFIINSISTTYINSSAGIFQYLILLTIILWGARLSTYLFIRIIKTKKDKRFDKIRENPIRFAQFWFFQAVSIWVISIPATISLSSKMTTKNTFLFSSGILIFLTGFLIETIADWQKYRFKSDPKNKDKWIESGLWRYSRHPNYFGEILVWWGIYFASLTLLPNWGITGIIGPLYVTYLLLKVSGIPTLEKEYEKRYKNNKKYIEYKNKTSILVPLPPKRK